MRFTSSSRLLGVAQDSWKVRPATNHQLWSAVGAISLAGEYEKAGLRISTSKRFRQGIKRRVFRNAPAALLPGDPGFPDKSGNNKRWSNFGPHVDWLGCERRWQASVRAAYALLTIMSPCNGASTRGLLRRWGTTIKDSECCRRTGRSLAGIAGGSPFPINSTRCALVCALWIVMSPLLDIRTPYVSSWDLSVQNR